MMSCASIVLTAAEMLVRAESRITFTPVTSAMPIISAAAVIAVRRGLRPELSRPSLPGTDQENSRPSTDTTGRLMIGVSSATPMNATSTPPRIVHRPPLPARPYAEQRRADRGDRRRRPR